MTSLGQWFHYYKTHPLVLEKTSSPGHIRDKTNTPVLKMVLKYFKDHIEVKYFVRYFKMYLKWTLNIGVPVYFNRDFSEKYGSREIC